jgi:hypothetical protein
MFHFIKKIFRKTNKIDKLPPSYDSISLKSTPPSYDSISLQSTPPSHDSISKKSTPPSYSSDVPRSKKYENSLHYSSDLSKSEEYEKPPQYDMSTDTTKLIDSLYTMGQKSYIIIDMSKVNFKELLFEIAKNHSSLSVYQFFSIDQNAYGRTGKLIYKPVSISIKINDSVVKITDKMIIIGFKNIVIEYENSFNTTINMNESKKNNSKKNNENTTSRMFQINNNLSREVGAVLSNFQMIGDEHIGTCTNYRFCYLNK